MRQGTFGQAASNAHTTLEKQSTLLTGMVQASVKKLEVCGLVKNRMPAARDGHSAVMVGQDRMIIFGGDRHRVPFSDMFTMSVKEQLHNKNIYQ